MSKTASGVRGHKPQTPEWKPAMLDTILYLDFYDFISLIIR